MAACISTRDGILYLARTWEPGFFFDTAARNDAMHIVEQCDRGRQGAPRSLEQTQLAKLTEIEAALAAIQVPTLKGHELGQVSIALGPPLDVDGEDGPRSASDASTAYFAPCDWPLDVLHYEIWEDR